MLKIAELLQLKDPAPGATVATDALNPSLYQASALEQRLLAESRQRYVRPNNYWFVQPEFKNLVR